MSIKNKLVTAFTIILVLLTGMGIISITFLSRVNSTSTIIANEVIPRINVASQINYDVARFRSFEYQHIVLTSIEDMDALELRMKDLKTEVNQYLEKYQSYHAEDVKPVKEEWDKYLAEHDKLIKLSRVMDTENSLITIKGDSKAAFDNIEKALNALIEASQKNSIETSLKGDVMYKSISRIVFIVVIVSILFGISMTVFITFSVTKPIKVLKLRLQELVERGGDLTQHIQLKSRDEIGQLANAVNQFIDNIRGIIIEVNQSVTGVEGTAFNVRDCLGVLSQNVDESSATIEELSAGMEEVKTQMNISLENSLKLKSAVNKFKV